MELRLDPKEHARARRAGLSDPLFCPAAMAAIAMGRGRYSPSQGTLGRLALVTFSLLSSLVTLVYRLRAMARKGEGAAGDAWCEVAIAAMTGAERTIAGLAPPGSSSAPAPPPVAPGVPPLCEVEIAIVCDGPSPSAADTARRMDAAARARGVVLSGATWSAILRALDAPPPPLEVVAGAAPPPPREPRGRAAPPRVRPRSGVPRTSDRDRRASP